LSNKQIKKAIDLQTKTLMFYPPPIPFTSVESQGRANSESEEKETTKEINMRLDPGDTGGETAKKTVKVLKEVTSEAWVLWHMEFEDIIRDVPL
jgi:hypothetical protein